MGDTTENAVSLLPEEEGRVAGYLKKSPTWILLTLALVALLTVSASAGPKIPPEAITAAIRRVARYVASRAVVELARRAAQRGLRVSYHNLEPILRDAVEKAAQEAAEAAERRGISWLGIIKAGQSEAEAVAKALGDAVGLVLQNRPRVEGQALLKAKRSGLHVGFRSPPNSASDAGRLRQDVRIAVDTAVDNEFESALRASLGGKSVEESSLKKIAKWLRGQGDAQLEDRLRDEVAELTEIVVNCVTRIAGLQNQIVPGKSIGGVLLAARIEDALKTLCGAFGKPEPEEDKGVGYVWDLGVHGHVGAGLSPSPWFYIKMDETNHVTLLYTSSTFFRTRYGIEVGDIREHVLESVRPSHSADLGEGNTSEYSRSLGLGWVYRNIDGVNRIVRLFVFPPK